MVQHRVLVLSTYVQMSLFNTHALISREAGSIIVTLSLHLLQYFV